MARNTVLILLLAASGIGIAGYWYAARTAPETNSAATAASVPATVSAADKITATTPASTNATSNDVAPASPPSDILAQWENDRTDAATRAAAIDALVSAPRTQAIPALKRILSAGSNDEKQLALKSLQTMATQQGDADSRIRDALREVISHGGDDAQGVQNTLGDIESLLSNSK